MTLTVIFSAVALPIIPKVEFKFEVTLYINTLHYHFGLSKSRKLL